MNRAWSLEHEVTHKQSKDCQVTGEAAAFGPNYSIQTPLLHQHYMHLHLHWFPCWRRNLNPTTSQLHSLPLSLAVLRAGEIWQRQQLGGCSPAMNVRQAGKAPVQALLGVSYNERHLRRAETERGTVKESLCISSG